LLVDSSDLSGGAEDDAALAEDREDPPEGSAGEGGADAGLDGAADARVCDAGFCDDFDEGPLGARWSEVDTSGGTASFGTPSLSPPNALRIVITDAAVSRAQVLLQKELGIATKLRCAFGVYVVARPTNAFVDLFRVRTSGSGIVDYHVGLGVSAGEGGTFREDVFYPEGGCGCPRATQNPATFPTQRWVRVAVDMDFIAANATLSYDGAVVLNAPFGGFQPTSTIVVGLGGVNLRGSTADVLFDDLACGTAP